MCIHEASDLRGPRVFYEASDLRGPRVFRKQVTTVL
jgi:hypothetical protein